MPYSGAQITRLGLSGIPRGLYGDFSGKTEVEVSPPKGGQILSAKQIAEMHAVRRRLMIQQGILKDDEEVIALLLLAEFTKKKLN